MTWVQPVALILGAAGVLGIVVAHLISRHRPRPSPFPTARFVAAGRPVASTRLSRPSDSALLMLRALTVMLLAAAFATPHRAPPEGSVARVVVVDRSRDVARLDDVVDHARREWREGDLLLVADSAASAPIAWRRGPTILDSLVRRDVAGSLSAAIVAGARAGVSLARTADSVELVLVTPGRGGDAATRAIREAWPGRVRVVTVTAAEPIRRRSIASRAADGDVVIAALRLDGRVLREDEPHTVRLVRGVATSADSTWAAAGHTLVVWPDDAQMERLWPSSSADTIGAVVASGRAVVAPFARGASPPVGVAVARWSDGLPAATEIALGSGCIRHVGVVVPNVGDVALTFGVRAIAEALTAGCTVPGGDAITAPIAPAIASLASNGPLASSATLTRLAPADESPPIVHWLLVVAGLLLIVEMGLRRLATRVQP